MLLTYGSHGSAGWTTIRGDRLVERGAYGAAQESNLPSRGLHDRTGFEDLREKAAPLS